MFILHTAALYKHLSRRGTGAPGTRRTRAASYHHFLFFTIMHGHTARARCAFRVYGREGRYVAKTTYMTRASGICALVINHIIKKSGAARRRARRASSLPLPPPLTPCCTRASSSACASAFHTPTRPWHFHRYTLTSSITARFCPRINMLRWRAAHCLPHATMRMSRAREITPRGAPQMIMERILPLLSSSLGRSVGRGRGEETLPPL